MADAEERPSKRTKLVNKPKEQKGVTFGFKLWALGQLKKGTVQAKITKSKYYPKKYSPKK